MRPSNSPQPAESLARGQVSTDAAQVYAEFFEPALFASWPDRVARAAAIARGNRVLDVACGTGVLARHLAHCVGPGGEVIGVDINRGMLAVAQRLAPHIQWRQGAAEALPFDNASFDAAVSQFGLMFFTDRVKAIQEMQRVTRPGGRMVVAVWDALENTPGYAALEALLRQLFGEDTAQALTAPFGLGEVDALAALFHAAGLPQAQISTLPGQARFPSLDAWVHTDIRGWTLADRIDDEQFDRLLHAARRALAAFVLPDGSVAFDAPAHIVRVTL